MNIKLCKYPVSTQAARNQRAVLGRNVSAPALLQHEFTLYHDFVYSLGSLALSNPLYMPMLGTELLAE